MKELREQYRKTVFFGNFALYHCRNDIRIKNSKTMEIVILDPAMLGIKMFSDDMKVVKSFEDRESCIMFLAKEQESKIVMLDTYYPEDGAGGIRVDTTDYSAGFIISNKFSIDAFGKSVLLVDSNRSEYILIKGDGKSFSNHITLNGYGAGFLVDESTGLILDRERLYVIHDGKRAEILLKQLRFRSIQRAHIKNGWLVIEGKDGSAEISLNDGDGFSFYQKRGAPISSFKND